jgi:hypothetical protein
MDALALRSHYGTFRLRTTSPENLRVWGYSGKARRRGRCEVKIKCVFRGQPTPNSCGSTAFVSTFERLHQAPGEVFGCEPALDIDPTSASNSDQLVTQQAIGRFENLPRIPWSGLPADMISSLVNQGCRFTDIATFRDEYHGQAEFADSLPLKFQAINIWQLRGSAYSR